MNENDLDVHQVGPLGLLAILIEMGFVFLGIKYSWNTIGPELTIALLIGFLILVFLENVNSSSKRS